MDSESKKRGKGIRTMMAILIPLAPKECANVLNRDAFILIRKTAPKEWVDYLNGKGQEPEPSEVYIYCTKGRGNTLVNYEHLLFGNPNNAIRNGKVVAKFTLREVTKHTPAQTIKILGMGITDEQREIADKSCLGLSQIYNYSKGKPIYLWHISDLEIFDKPKELSEFWVCTEKECIFSVCHKYMHCRKYLKKAPRGWQYVEAPRC